ncbi:hypothetical protein PMIN03_012148 [Paraphaeosphaeria minitans]
MTQLYFPAFEECPHENDADLDYYELKDGFFLFPKRHWCLVAEIVEIEFFIRLRLWVKDRTGHEFPVLFYIEDDQCWLDPTRFRKGQTIAILYAEQHYFFDTTVGIRQENTSTIEVFDMSPKAIISLGEEVHNRENADLRECHACGINGPSLLKCAQCNCRRYCNKQCQKRGWQQEGHRKDCRKEGEIVKFLAFKREHSSEHASFL